MRQIGTLASEQEVRRLADYLLTLGIRSQVDHGDESFAVWAIDEDRVPQARVEFERFHREPDDARYTEATRAADRIRDELIRREKQSRRNVVDVRAQWR